MIFILKIKCAVIKEAVIPIKLLHSSMYQCSQKQEFDKKMFF